MGWWEGEGVNEWRGTNEWKCKNLMFLFFCHTGLREFMIFKFLLSKVFLGIMQHIKDTRMQAKLFVARRYTALTVIYIEHFSSGIGPAPSASRQQGRATFFHHN